MVFLIRQQNELMNRTICGEAAAYKGTGQTTLCIIIDTDIFLSQMTFLINLLDKIDESKNVLAIEINIKIMKYFSSPVQTDHSHPLCGTKRIGHFENAH